MPTEFYVAPTGDDDWSGTLASPTADGTDGPFETIERARAAVREHIEDGMDDHVTVYLREGTYLRAEPLVFSTADSGRDGYEVRYRNYPDEQPRLLGGTELEGWEPVDGREGVYKTTVDPDWAFNELYENGHRATVARYPTKGYLRVEAPADDDPTRTFRYAEGDLPDLPDRSDLQVYIWPGGPEGEFNWFSDIADVTDLDEDARTIHSAALDRYDLGPGSRYFLQNTLAFLDSPGEFYRSPEGEVFYYPEAPIEETEIVAPTDTRVLAVEGESAAAPVRNMRFEGIEVCVTDRPRELTPNEGSHRSAYLTDECAGVELHNAEAVTLTRCRVHDTALHGVMLVGHAQDITISGCEIANIGQTGIQLRGPTSREYVNKGHTITDNHVHHVGTLIGHGHGIALAHSGNNVISHNRVHHSARISILVSSMPRPTTMTGYGHTVDEPMTIDGIDVSPETVGVFQHSRNNRIEYNDCSHANLDSQDTGLIYTNTGGRGNVIHGNRLHDSEIKFSFGFGLYLDDTSDGVTCTNNLIHDLNHHGNGNLRYGIYAKGLDDVLLNNVVVDNDASAAPVGSHEHGGTWNRHQVIERNVFADSGPNVYAFKNWSRDRIAKADHNVVHHEDGDYGIAGIPAGYALDGESYDVEDFDDWRSFWDQRYDQHSEIADPQFMDREANDYRFRYDSPVYDHGIETIDHAKPGLTANFPFAEPEPLERVFLHVEDRPGTPAVVDLDVGDGTRVAPTARTETGFVADLEGATIEFESGAESVATVTEDGRIDAVGPGVTTVAVTVETADTSFTSRLHVRVANP